MLSLIATLAVAALNAADPLPVPLHDLESLLARPVSPGVIALLLPHGGDERAGRRAVESLSHSDPNVRAAAARFAGIADLKAAGSMVVRALETETDRSAAAEQVRAAVPLNASSGDPALIAMSRRHQLVDVLAHTLAAVRGPAALPLLDALREGGLSEHYDGGRFVDLATRGGKEGLNVAATYALRKGESGTWAAVLGVARQPGAELSPGMLLAAVRSSKPELRAAAYWHLALTHRRESPPWPELEAALAQSPEAVSPESADLDAAFALVVLRRASKGRDFGGDWGARAASGTPVIPLYGREDAVVISRLLTKAEARALSLRTTNGRDDARFQWEAKKAPEKPGQVDGEQFGGVSFAGGLPPGTLRDLLAITGCEPGPDVRAMGFVDYRLDGRARKVSVAEVPVSPGCGAAAGPALGFTLAPRGLIDPALPGRRTVLIIPMNAAALDCADQPEPPEAERVPEVSEPPGPKKITAPKKVKNVPPWYPGKARAEGRQGTVVLEAVISTTGCIRSARVVSGVSPDFDAVAMISAAQWIYTPTLLDGRPVPVIMTITVNFKLSR